MNIYIFEKPTNIKLLLLATQITTRTDNNVLTIFD